jgi:predicted nuclease of predicted toxin-antitoxin system
MKKDKAKRQASDGLKGQSDLQFWEYAARYGFILVSKDNDFRQPDAGEGLPL